MRAMWVSLLTCAAALCAAPAPSFCQQPLRELPPDATAQLLERLPPDWKPIIAKYRTFNFSSAWYLKRVKDDAELRGEILQQLVRVPGAEDFVLDHTFDGSVPTPRVVELLNGMSVGSHWVNDRKVTTVLEKVALSATEPEVSLAAIDAVRSIYAQRVLNGSTDRLHALEMAKTFSPEQSAIYDEETAKWQQAEEKLTYTAVGIDIPTFVRTPPPVFEVKAAGPSIRVLVMGDYGTGDRQQKDTAATMLALHKQHPFDFGITTGDNFQSFTCKLKSPTDALWNSVFEDVYGPLRIDFYPVFGNHDWACDMPLSELMHTGTDGHWHFPAPYYTYVAGPVQFFALNTQYDDAIPTDAELAWLKMELDKSTAKWKVVYTHFPIFSSSYTDAKLVTKLMPLLRGKADVYINGHIHNLQEHKPVDGVSFFNISASGGRGGVPVNHRDAGTEWGVTAFGFGVMEASEHEFTVRFIGADGKTLHETVLRK